MTLDDYISKMMTCSNDLHCKKEEWCFEVAKYANECRSRERLRYAMARVQQVEIDDEDMVYFAPPHWESHLPPRWVE